MDEQERVLRHKFSLIEGVGARTFLQIIQKWGSIEAFLKEPSIHKINNMSKLTLEKIPRACDEIDIVQICDELSYFGAKFVVYGDPHYPKFLYNIYEPPLVLYYKGDIQSVNFERAISIVGTRRMSRYGESVIKDLVTTLVGEGFCTVSGMAYGVDKRVHEITMSQGGATAAVLASPINEPTPVAHFELSSKIAESGVVMTEIPIGGEYSEFSFPRRNRIIAGLTMVTVVIEAPEKSGALITANFAFRENRNVFAVPGNIYSANSKGVNSLIKNNKAKLISSFYDILEELPGYVKHQSDAKLAKADLSKLECAIIEILKCEPLSEDLLVARLDKPASVVIGALSALEIEGILSRDEEGNYYIVL